MVNTVPEGKIEGFGGGYVLVLDAVRKLELLEENRNLVAVGRGRGKETDWSFTRHDVLVNRL